MSQSDVDRFSDKVHAWSAMLNGLLDFGGQDGIGGYIGAGAGYANVHALDNSKGKFAWQALAGVYYPVTGNVDIGLKGRYFSTSNINTNDTLAVSGNPNRLTVGTTAPVTVDQTTNAVLSTDSSVKFRGWSLLASLVYNFGPPEVAPPPPPPPAPPPPPPATQTCPDGSVILATSTCPAPPPPPPPPPAERGERGN